MSSTDPHSVRSACLGAVPAAPSICEPATPLTFQLITERARFDALEEEWNALFARAGRSTQVFQTFNWNWHWANHYLGSSGGGIPGLTLSVVAGRHNGRLAMVWPLVVERVRGLAQIFWMGEPVGQYGDVLLDRFPNQLSALRQSWQFIKSNIKGDLVRLRRVRTDAAVAPLMAEIGALSSNRQTAPYLDLASAPDFAAYEQRYSSKARKNRRRLLRRLEEQGSVVFKRLHGGKEARALSEKALELKAAWLQERGLISHAISDKRMNRFFADIAEGGQRSTGCIVTALVSNGETAAAEVIFPCQDRLAVHVIAYDLRFEKSGAGVILFEQGIRDACNEGYATVDMLAPGDNYKLDWADAQIEVNDWCRPLTLAGHTYAHIYLGLVRDRVKVLAAALPQSWRHIVAKGQKQAASIS